MNVLQTKKTRKQVNLPRREISTWEEADQALKDIAILEEQMNKEIAAYNQEEQERRARLTARHAPLQAQILAIELGLESFAKAHREEFQDKRTKQLKHGELSFRLHPPAVERLKGMTWLAVLELVRRAPKWSEKFIRIKEELNKDAIIALYSSNEISANELASLGITVEQKESFGYKTKLAIEE